MNCGSIFSFYNRRDVTVDIRTGFAGGLLAAVHALQRKKLAV
jgi:hypothetical protein